MEILNASYALGVTLLIVTIIVNKIKKTENSKNSNIKKIFKLKRK